MCTFQLQLLKCKKKIKIKDSKTYIFVKNVCKFIIKKNNNYSNKTKNITRKINTKN